MAYLFLDESGRFEDKEKKSRSVVGGFFIADNVIPDDFKTFFTNFHLQTEIFHACEIKDKELYATIIDSLIDLCKKKNIIPLIFIPQRGFFIIDDATTYLNVLIDGIVQFIKSNTKLLQNVSKLNITIEHRVGLENLEYKNRIKEAIEKEKILTPSINKNIKSEIKIENKNNNLLQIADLIVHTFYRIDRDSDSLNKDTVEKFKEWIETYKLYIHTSQNITTKIMDLMDKGLYEYAIKDLINNHNDTRIDRILPSIITQLCKLSIFYLNSLLLSVFWLYYNAINIERKLSNFENDLLFIIEKFLPALEEELNNFGKHSYDIYWAYIYCYMILLTLYNHKGDVKNFEQTYKNACKIFDKTPFDIDSISARLRIRVLYGVHCTNMFQFDECYEQMSILEKRVTDAFTFLNESDENLMVQPRIVGEITGTKLQAMMYATLIRGGNWDEVREQSNIAIKNFEYYSEDLMRQYQYRAQIETYAKNFLQARHFLAKGCGITYTTDEDLLETILKKILIFPLLHFFRIYYVELITNADNVKSYYEIVTSVFANNNSQIETVLKNKAYPVPSIFHYLMMIYGLFNSNRSFDEAGKFYREACNLCKNDNNVTLKTIALSCHIDYMWLLQSLSKKDNSKEIEKAYKKDWSEVLEESKELPLYKYLCNSKEKLDTTPLHQWNTLWYLFPY